MYLKSLAVLVALPIIASAGSPQTISFAPIPNQILGISPLLVVAKASSGLPVSFVSTLPAVCKNSGGLVMLLTVGTCSITASQSGNGSFNAAAPVTQSFTVSLAQASGSFLESTASPVGTIPNTQSVAKGDFNGDGVPDLVTLDYVGNRASVLLGDGLGGFTATGTSIVTGVNPSAVLVGDFNGDGFQDFAVANLTGDTVTVLLGNGSGGFAAATGSPFAAGSCPIAITGGDFNGDGVEDLAIPDCASGGVTVLLGNGSGGFAAATGSPFTVGFSPSAVAVGDFNGDGKQDLAVTNEGDNDVTVLLGNGSGGFTQAAGSPFAANSSPVSVVVGDFNGDGKQDLAVANLISNNVTVLLGNGSGGFTAAAGSPFGVGQGPLSVVVGDFNGNGKQDLATANSGGNNVTVLLGNGSGGFTEAGYSPVGTDMVPVSLAVGDFNGDGIEDFATANYDGGDITVLLGFKAGTTVQTITFAPLSNVTFGVAPFTIAATSDSGLKVKFVSAAPFICTIPGAGTKVKVVAGGVCTIVASQPGNSIYAAAATVMRSFTINPAAQTITFAPLSTQLPSASPALSATASSGLNITFTSNTLSVCTVTGTTATLLTAGTCSITASQSGNPSFSAATPITRTFTVLALQTITFGALSNVTLGVSPFTIAATASSALAVSFASTTLAVCTVSGTAVTAVAAGLCSITASQAGNATYAAAAPVTRSFSVLIVQTITFGPLSTVTQGVLPFTIGATTSSALAVSFASTTQAVCTVSGTTVTVVGAGTCSITASQAGNGVYAAATPVIQSFTVLATQTISFAALSNIAFGTAPFTLSATATSALPVSFTSTTPIFCTVSGATLTIVISGGCAITASQAGNATFAAAPSVTQSFTVFFLDVAPTDYYYDAINSLAQHGITAGCGNNDFCPQEIITRDQMAIFVVRAILGSDNFTTSPTPYFTDVQTGTFGFKWIQKLHELGVTAGCTVTQYCPTQVVSRDQMAIFIERARLGLTLAGGTPTFTYPLSPLFADVPTSEFAYPWIQRLKEDNITAGTTPTTYSPFSPVIRGDMAIFVMRGAFNQFLPAGTPVVTQISPSILALGTSGTYTITGANTNFAQGVTQLSPIPGVTIGTIAVASPTSLTVQLTAAGNAVAQPYSIVAISGTEQAVLPNGLVLQ